MIIIVRTRVLPSNPGMPRTMIYNSCGDNIARILRCNVREISVHNYTNVVLIGTIKRCSCCRDRKRNRADNTLIKEIKRRVRCFRVFALSTTMISLLFLIDPLKSALTVVYAMSRRVRIARG